jgi:hypothetical protein
MLDWTGKEKGSDKEKHEKRSVSQNVFFFSRTRNTGTTHFVENP